VITTGVETPEPEEVDAGAHAERRTARKMVKANVFFMEAS
jgi:hypothetical protein